MVIPYSCQNLARYLKEGREDGLAFSFCFRFVSNVLLPSVVLHLVPRLPVVNVDVVLRGANRPALRTVIAQVACRHRCTYRDRQAIKA